MTTTRPLAGDRKIRLEDEQPKRLLALAIQRAIEIGRKGGTLAEIDVEVEDVDDGDVTLSVPVAVTIGWNEPTLQGPEEILKAMRIAEEGRCYFLFNESPAGWRITEPSGRTLEFAADGSTREVKP